MRKMQNSTHIEGYVYQHTLEVKTVQNPTSENLGKEFIAGNLEVAVDEEMTNVIPVHFTYVTPQTKSGAENRTYTALKKIIDEKRSVVEVGKDEAIKVKIDTALAVNDFYNQQDELVTTKVNEGGFVTITTSPLCEEKGRNQFIVDMIVTNIRMVEADPEKNIPEEYMIVKGAVFNFRNALIPVEFNLKDKQGIALFESLDIESAPVLKHVWGRINCLTSTVEKTEETAFGEAAVRSYERKTKEWLITGASPAEFEFADDSQDLTPAELRQAMQDRETMLADVKKRNEEYKAQKAAGNVATATTAPAAKAGEFKF